MVTSHRPSPVNYPPLDGSLFLPELLEFNAQHNSDVTFFVYDTPDSSDLVSITHLDFYQACHRAAQKIRPGRAGTGKDIVALLGNFDTLLFHTVFMGIIFAGLVVRGCFLISCNEKALIIVKPFPMSPRNSAPAVINMMEKTNCHRLITTRNSLGSLIDGIKTDFASQGTETSQLQIDEVPALRDLYPALVRDSPNQAFFPYLPPTSRSSENDILFYLHSSGSTGFPKSIPMTNLTTIHWCLTRK
ncbi:hypothetical protein AZE42_08273 [Rhizopogon vesiculosus]|uniref:AMP-dependent synthetase/ligase domain-containing protein n=1 Tax=Rhizopogon vesiculosus TaxID=180088 RepID=A0A1J8QCJ9_9AGAM|nr:hypothetical protein AZE42_08273 [Rhizopogon vesiculosus]